MAKFKINGGKPLAGSVRLGGAKNASFKLLIAACLQKTNNPVRLLNFSHIQDVEVTREIIESLGGETKAAGERTIFVNAKNLDKWQIPTKFGQKSRASSMFIPILLHRFGQAFVPFPGGDKIGSRPLDRHFQGLQAMGAKINQTEYGIELQADQLVGTEYNFEKNSHTGTETLIMAAVLAKGVTILNNAAQEPEVDDLIVFLNKMGAKITRTDTRQIQIEGVERLGPCIHKIMPDRNEAVSYACAALVTKGDVIVENAKPELLGAFLEHLERVKAGYEVGDYGIRFFYRQPLIATDMTTQIHPGFMTDWQPLWTVLMTQAQGVSTIHETIFPDRFQHVAGLVKFGADIEFVQPKVADPDQTYNFNLDESNKVEHQHCIKITGPNKFQPTSIDVYDLRSGATFALAALATTGESWLNKVELIDRGYEYFDQRLRSLGADIVRVE